VFEEVVSFVPVSAFIIRPGFVSFGVGVCYRSSVVRLHPKKLFLRYLLSLVPLLCGHLPLPASPTKHDLLTSSPSVETSLR
jgi:hypothetical protein